MEEVKIIRELFLGFIKLHILYHASKEDVCGVFLSEELSRHGYDISPGTLYPALHALERAEYLQQENKVVDGRQRKYYRATASGIIALENGKKQAVELINEISE
ncbi:MAG TPA: PadR family transcriptional regulator [Actinobacteria bacterium]|nr:PadR family transcriptional regulator [Actinomycetota bacterium]